ncbi:MAG: PKD domain-containing protein [Cyclobacteriaceae bacterium]|nr:PKD domain-containing protein [Cyclobacteriaceae bacterium]
MLLISQTNVFGQCGGIMEPGFAFLTSSRGCAPFTVNIQTIYLSSVPGTQYFVDWGDGTPEQTYVQGATPVIMSHIYPLASVNCGYDVVIDASNACNPRGSVVPITTQVIVWTNDVISIDPAVYRVCAGYAANVSFTDNSDWNCFPRATRENNAPRWIQWIYGTGPLPTFIPGIQVNSVTPGSYPYLNPAPNRNPIYPVTAPGQVSLPINVPVTTLADIGKEFEITLKNWNQCNAYDDNLLDGNAFNPVSGNLVNGDNPPQITRARIVIVDAPQPTYVTRLGNAGGPIQTIFCLNDIIYFDNNTPAIAGANFQYTWQFYDNNTGTGVPLATSGATNPTFSYSSSGQKMIRLSVRDQNAAGNCIAIYEALVSISPSLVANIQTTDFLNNPITPDFCQSVIAPFTGFQVRFTDASVGVVTPTTEWRWEFYDENNIMVLQAPLAGGFSSTALGPFDRTFTNRGIYRVRLIIRDNVTACQTIDEVNVRVYQNPVPVFTANRVCQGTPASFNEASTLVPINGESIVLREWDFNYNGSTFIKDPAFDNQTTFTRSLGAAGLYQVALRVTTNQNGCSDLLVIPVRVDPLPTANFVPDVVSGCSVLTVIFTNNSVGGQPDIVDRFVWEVDERGGLGFLPVSTQRPTDIGFTNQFVHDFINVTTVNKLFDVRLRVVTVNNCERISPPVIITVFPGTASGFISTNYSPFNDNCSPVSVNFSVDPQTQSLGPTNYQWRISDVSGVISNVSTGTTPTYTYNFINTTPLIEAFQVQLTTTLPSGCYGDSVRVIRVSPVPVSNFNIDTLVFDCEKMRLRFEASQKGLQYHWTVSENTIMMLNTSGSSDMIEYEVLRSGVDINLAVGLDTRNIANCTSNITTQSIVVPRRDIINTSFTVTPLTQSLPASTVFITNTTNPGPWTYEWDFGDGITSNTSTTSFSHVYATYGTYVIKLTVTNNVCIETQTANITIFPIPPVVNFSYDPASGCSPLKVKFTNLSMFADPATYLWDFGDGAATSRAANPTYTYFLPGKYTVSLSASNISGTVITETKQMIIEVFEKPIARFDIKPKLLYIPGGIMYTKNNSIGAGRYEWNFGDGETSDLVEPQHVYEDEGIFDISLIAISPHDCADTTLVKGAVITQKGGQLLVPNAFSPNLSGVQSSPGSGQSDGKNDVFLPVMRGVTQFEMLVFNRWGQLLFESRDPQIGWDGYFNGKLCAQDVYVFKISAKYENGETVVRTGDINLIR